MCAIIYTDNHWRAFGKLVGRPNLVDEDERFATLRSRTIYAHDTYSFVREIMPSRTTAEWLKLLEEADIPATPLHTLETIFDDPHLNRHRVLPAHAAPNRRDPAERSRTCQLVENAARHDHAGSQARRAHKASALRIGLFARRGGGNHRLLWRIDPARRTLTTVEQRALNDILHDRYDPLVGNVRLDLHQGLRQSVEHGDEHGRSDVDIQGISSLHPS